MSFTRASQRKHLRDLLNRPTAERPSKPPLLSQQLPENPFKLCGINSSHFSDSSRSRFSPEPRTASIFETLLDRSGTDAGALAAAPHKIPLILAVAVVPILAVAVGTPNPSVALAIAVVINKVLLLIF